jgi:hypothetical protein
MVQGWRCLLAEWSAAYVASLPDSAFACVDDDGRHYPHHDAGGSLDLPHLRNALSRVAQEDTTSCGVAHLRAHAEAADIGAKRMDAVKRSGKDHIEGLAIPFSADIDGESFSRDTDFCLDWFGPSGRPVLYDHGLDRAMKTNVIGRQVEYDERDEGIWARSQLDMAAKYRKAVDQLIEEGALGYSSGSIPHLATPRGGAIKRWPWVELSLTPIPAHPATRVYAVKAADAVEHLREVDIDIPAPLEAALKALDDWAETRDAPPGSEAFTARLERVSSEVVPLLQHSREHFDMRAKSGRVLSNANRARLLALVEAWEPSLSDLKALLSETDPDAEKSLSEAMWDAQRTLARLAGVPV